MQHFMAFLKLPTKVLTTLSNLYFRLVYPNHFYFVSYYLSYTAQIIHVDCEERQIHQGLHVINSRLE
jgi:hypothetical protein